MFLLEWFGKKKKKKTSFDKKDQGPGDGPGKPKKPLTKEDEEELKEKLRSLGYM